MSDLIDVKVGIVALLCDLVVEVVRALKNKFTRKEI